MHLSKRFYVFSEERLPEDQKTPADRRGKSLDPRIKQVIRGEINVAELSSQFHSENVYTISRDSLLSFMGA